MIIAINRNELEPTIMKSLKFSDFFYLPKIQFILHRIYRLIRQFQYISFIRIAVITAMMN